MFLVFLALIVVACMKRRAWGRRASWSWDDRPQHGGQATDGPRRPSVKERFEEWHRTVHAREHGDEADDTERV